MKKIKKLASLLLALVMVLCMTVTGFAATVTVPDALNGHSFKAYQIFAGTQAEGSSVLGDVTWGAGINSEAFLSALKADADLGELFAEAANAADVAAALSGKESNSDVAKKFAEIAFDNKTDNGTSIVAGSNELAKGYYLIVDVTELGAGDAKNAALLQVTNNITINVKTDKPTVEKKVKENVKYVQDGGFGTGYNDVADYNIGDEVPFAFYSKVPNMTYYDTYKYVFHDTMSAGLSLPEKDAKITVKIGNRTLGESEYTVNRYPDDNCSFEIEIDDLKAVDGISTGDEIRVDFVAILNENAVVGLDGNTNEVYLEYSSNPNDSTETNTTEEDKVIVFTYELDTTKVAGGNTTQKLQGAEFKLSNADGKWVTVDAESGKVTGWVDQEENATTLTSGADGLFKVIGLDAGTYQLKETKAPAGYNLLTTPIEVIISAETENGQTWTGDASNALVELNVTANGTAGTGDKNTGIVNITVENNSGSLLPSTGGIGTTIFYAAGIILMAGAVFFVVRRRRAN